MKKGGSRLVPGPRHGHLGSAASEHRSSAPPELRSRAASGLRISAAGEPRSSAASFWMKVICLHLGGAAFSCLSRRSS
jgi:hypothetical protein